jgi:SAM-dependent methyltransferase
LQRQDQVVLPPNPAFLQRVGLQPGMRGLDLGCGAGITSCEIARFVYPGEVVGIDLSQSMIEQAQQLQEAQGVSNLTVQLGRAEDPSFPEAAFDFIYARLLLQHLAEPQQVLANVYRMLKPGGIFCAIDVDHSWFALHPEPASFAALCQQLVMAQQAQGGDPFVGRKLGSYCLQAELMDVQVQVEVIHSDRIGLETFFSLLSFGAPFLLGQSGLDELAVKAREEVYALLHQPNAWAGFGVFVVTARKP